MMHPDIQRAITLANAGQKGQALDLLREVVRRDPSQAVAYRWIAHITAVPREAYAAIQCALHLDPNDQWTQEYAARLQAWMRQQQAQSPPAAAPSAAAKPARRSPRGSVLAGLVAVIVLVLAGGAVGLTLVLGPGFGPGDPVILDQAQAEGEAAILPATATPIPTGVPATDLPTSTPQPTVTPVEPTDPPPPTDEPSPEPAAAPTDPPPTDIPTLSSVPIIYNPQTTYYIFDAETIPQIQDAIFAYGPGETGADGTHAIATTTYEMSIAWKTIESNQVCNLTESSITLNLTYLYPQWNPVGSPTPDVYGEWDRFIAHVVEHEEHHASIAYGCAEELAGQVAALEISGPCQPVIDQLNALADQMYQTCDQRQIAFDDVEGQTSFPLP
jgi:predicted secreted Zn-dependent protease